MNENKNTSNEIIRNSEDESSEVIAKIETDTAVEMQNNVDNHLKDEVLFSLSEEESVDESNIKDEVVTAVVKNESKQQKTRRLVEQARYIVKEADDQSKECKLLLVDDLADYEDAKINLKENGYDTCKALLETMGYRSKFDAPVEEEATVIEGKKEIAPIVIKRFFSGKFTGLFSALVAGILTAVGLLYFETEKLGMTLDVSKVPSLELIEKMTSWFSTLIGMEPNIYVGAGIFGVSVVTVMAIVYALHVSLKKNSNLHYAVKQFVEAELYAEKKYDCKDAFEKVDAHMKETIKTFKLYEVLFNEQQGKLQRIVHLEGAKSESKDYHEKSFKEIANTQKLIKSIKNFMAVSMSKDGKLHEESALRLGRLKKEMDDMIERLYMF